MGMCLSKGHLHINIMCHVAEQLIQMMNYQLQCPGGLAIWYSLIFFPQDPLQHCAMLQTKCEGYIYSTYEC